MVAYGFGLLPFINGLKSCVPEVHQPWNADDAGTGSTFEALQHYLTKLKTLSPRYGYFP